MKDNNKTRTDIDATLAEVEEKAKIFTEAHRGESAEDILAQMRGEEPASEDLEGVTWNKDRIFQKDVEYTRTDAFINKACKWIEEVNNHHHIMRYSDSCEPPLNELTEWFKNYMKGE